MIWRHLAQLRCRTLDRDLQTPLIAQERCLGKALTQIRGCRIAEAMKLDGVRTIDAFRRRVPVTTHRFYKGYISAAIRGEHSVMFRGKPSLIAQTGGTTAAPKLLPFNRALIRSYRRFNLDTVFRYMVESGNYGLLSDRLFIVAANPEADRTATGVPIGFITGIMAQTAPRALKRRFAPNIGVIRNPDMAQKIRDICKQTFAQRHRVQAAFGLTPYVMATWQNLIEYAQTQPERPKSIPEIFPHLKVVFHGGSTFSLYRERMERLTGNGVHHRNVYSAAEGPIASQFSNTSPGLALTLDGVFFEFLPEEELDVERPRTLLIDEIERNVPYYLIMTTQGGLLRYRIGDRVRFIETDPPLLSVGGKIEDQIDLSAEKMGVDQAAAVLEETGRALGIEVLDFLVCPVEGTLLGRQLAHEWIIECESEHEPPDIESFRRELELRLAAKSPMYKELRAQSFSLAAPEFTFVRPGTFQRYIEGELSFGQQKMLHMHNDRRAVERLLSYARAH